MINTYDETMHRKKKKVNFSEKKNLQRPHSAYYEDNCHAKQFCVHPDFAFCSFFTKQKGLRGSPLNSGIFALPWSPRPQEVLDRGLHQLMQGSSPVQRTEKSFGFLSQRKTSICSNHTSPPGVRGSVSFRLAAVVYTMHWNQSNNRSRYLPLSTMCQALCWGSIPRISLNLHNNLKRRALVPI